jgi:MFS family permease
MPESKERTALPPPLLRALRFHHGSMNPSRCKPGIIAYEEFIYCSACYTVCMLSKEAKVLLIGSGIWYFGEGLFGPLIALFSNSIGGTILDLSWAWASYLIVYGGLSIVFGKLSDTRLPKGELMVFGYALNALFTFGYLLVDSPMSLFFVQAGLGVAAALATPTWNALFDEYSGKGVGGTAWGISEGMASIVTGCSILIGAVVVNQYSFHTLFFCMGVIQTIAAIYQTKLLLLKRA